MSTALRGWASTGVSSFAQRRVFVAPAATVRIGLRRLSTAAASVPNFRGRRGTGVPPMTAACRVGGSCARLASTLTTPSAALFKELSPTAAPADVTGQVTLRTGYAACAHTGGRGGAVASSSSPSPSPSPAAVAPSYVVVSPAEFQSILSEALSTEACGGNPSSLNVKNGNHRTRELQRLLRRTDEELAPLLETKGRVDTYAFRRYYPLLKYTCLALLVTQLVVYCNWIFVVFDWNLVEPTTYFLAYTGVFCSLLYHYARCDVTTGESFTWRNLFVHLAERKANKLYARQELDMERFEALMETRRVAVAALQRYEPVPPEQHV